MNCVTYSSRHLCSCKCTLRSSKFGDCIVLNVGKDHKLVDRSEEQYAQHSYKHDHKSCKRVQDSCNRAQDECSLGERQLILLQIFNTSVQNYRDSYIQSNLGLLYHQNINPNYQIHCDYLNTLPNRGSFIQDGYNNLERCYIMYVTLYMVVIIEHISYGSKQNRSVKYGNDIKNIFQCSKGCVCQFICMVTAKCGCQLTSLLGELSIDVLNSVHV